MNTYVWRRWNELDLLVRHMTLANLSFSHRIADAPPRAIHVHALLMRSPFWAALDPLAAAYQQHGTTTIAKLALLRNHDNTAVLHGLASILKRTNLADQLMLAMPEAPATLMKALDRCGDVVHDPEFYDLLVSLLRVPAFEPVLLARNAVLDTDLLLRLDASRHLGPQTLKAFAANRITFHTAEILQAVINATVEVHGEDVIPLFEEALAKWNRENATEHCDRLMNRLPAPRAPWDGNNCLSLITTPAQLKATGRRFNNCLADYRIHMVVGAQAFYIWNGSGLPAVLCIARQHNGIWALHELKGMRNATLPSSQVEEIRTQLKAAGISPNTSLTRTLENFRFAQMHHFHDIRFAPD